VINSIAGESVGASSSKPAITKSAMGDRDTWIKLLVAQMTKGQDPMNPMNPDQMATQLAQFSSVEQLMNISERLDAMAGANNEMLQAIDNSSAVATLGKTVVALGDRVQVPENGLTAVQAKIGAPGGQATLLIHDASGRVVAQRDLGAVQPGTRSLDLDLSAEGLEPGSYRYSVDVVDTDGNPVPVQTYARARVEGIRQGQNGPVLIAGGVEIPLINVIEVGN
jgi:flagellar basal-body rod modification protein FlgD